MKANTEQLLPGNTTTVEERVKERLAAAKKEVVKEAVAKEKAKALSG